MDAPHDAGVAVGPRIGASPGRLGRLAERLAGLGAQPGDPRDERLRKGTLILASSLIVVLAIVWVVTYFALGLPVSASIPLGYQVASIATLAWFVRTKRFGAYRTSQLVMMLVLPCLLQASIGGFVASSGVVLWASFTPVAALALVGARRSVPWFAAFAVLLVVLGPLDASFTDRDIPAGVVTAFFVLNVGGVTLTNYLILGYFVRQRERAMEALEQAHAALEVERERSERLLLNVLPEPIAERLKRDEGVIAERFEEVTVLFADLVGFTTLAEGMDPRALVELLDDVFSAFDELADDAGLEKIKTVGDAYMLAGGLPEPREDHAIAVARIALEMRRAIAAISARRGLDDRLSLRIGIDSGPVVAGVIGRRKFIYDLWGDTVNTASRMQSHGLPNEIQVTDRAFRRLRDSFDLKPRGMVEIKGKGTMEAYLLLGERSSPGEGSVEG